ncbi:MAG: glycosyltransferase family 4 protein [Pseudomonadota bacterium]
MRIAAFVTHPIQYYAPIFRTLSNTVDLHVYYGQVATSDQQASAGFGVQFDWDVDLLSGYSSSLLDNVAPAPNVHDFGGCDVPSVGKLLKEERFDAIIVFGWYQKFFLQTLYAAKRLGIPVLVRGDSQLDTPRNPIKRFAKNIGYPLFLRAFDAALYVGEKSREYYQYYRYPNEKLFFSPHSIDTQYFAAHATDADRSAWRAELGVRDETKLILFCGKLLEGKRPLDLIDALGRARLRTPSLELVIAGSGPLEEAVHHRANQLGVPVHFLGFCNQSRLPSIYAAADILCLPSAHETWGLVCNEALACGTPIIVSDAVGCAADLANDNNIGRVYPSGNADALAEAILATASQPPPPGSIRHLSDRYSVTASTDGILSALDFTCRTGSHRS